MNTLIVYASVHHGNTKDIAKEIHSVLDGKLVDFTEVEKEDVEEADLVGFGSGIYKRKFHKSLLTFIKELPEVEGKKAFVFSTAGAKKNVIFNVGNRNCKKLLREKGFEIIGEFESLGYDTYGPWKLIGGINKGRPDEKDKKRAREFAESLRKI